MSATTPAAADTRTTPTRPLGASGVAVGALGFGAMGLSGIYGPSDDAESIALLRAAVDRGVDLIDTADVYGDGHNEELIGRALADRRDEVKLATKTGGGGGTGLGRPEAVRTAIDASLARLGVDHVDLYYLHRVDPDTPIEETVGAFAELVHAGKVLQIGLSEVSPSEIERASSVHPIAAVQQEYSLFTRELERDVVPATAAAGITLVPYSPLGRGVLSGKHRSPSQVENIDVLQARYPRFAAEAFEANQQAVRALEELATRLGATASQVALAWLLAQGPDIVPIFGTRRLANLDSNLGALDLTLDAEVLAELDALFPIGATSGNRYADEPLARAHRSPSA